MGALALETIKNEFDVPFIGVVKPGAKMAAQATQNKRIGIIATEGTISSGIYEQFLKTTNPEVEVFGKACPLFVPLAEEGWLQDDVTRQVAERYLAELKVNPHQKQQSPFHNIDLITDIVPHLLNVNRLKLHF